MKPASSTQGFTLVEALIVVSIVGIAALVAVPALQAQDATKLDAGAIEVASVLRFAISEATRTPDTYILVDGSAAGRLKIFNSNAAAAAVSPITDPLTKRALEVDFSTPRLWTQVGMAPRFMQGGAPYNQLLVSQAQLLVFDSGVSRGALQANSGVALTVGPLTSLVAINEITRRVAIPQP